MNELTFVPPILQRGRTQTKIVRCLLPYRTMLGRRFQVFSAQRLGVCEWQLTFGKHWLRAWPDPPLLEKSFAGDCRKYTYVRQVEVVLPQGKVMPEALGPDVRVVGYSVVVPPYNPHPEMLSRYVRRVWFLSALNWRDGVSFLPDKTCVNPRGGPVRMLQTTPEQIEMAQKELTRYLMDCEAIAAGKVQFLGLWMTPAEYKKTREFEEQNRLR
jgi:hypothetical protein